MSSSQVIATDDTITSDTISTSRPVPNSPITTMGTTPPTTSPSTSPTPPTDTFLLEITRLYDLLPTPALALKEAIRLTTARGNSMRKWLVKAAAYEVLASLTPSPEKAGDFCVKALQAIMSVSEEEWMTEGWAMVNEKIMERHAVLFREEIGYGVGKYSRVGNEGCDADGMDGMDGYGEDENGTSDVGDKKSIGANSPGEGLSGISAAGRQLALADYGIFAQDHQQRRPVMRSLAGVLAEASADDVSMAGT